VRRLIDEVSEGALRAGARVAVAADPALAASVRPNALKRALSNLVMNAAAHGEHVEVAAHANRQGGLEIWIDDDGPGIPPDLYEDAFRPFARLDEARNQNVKGVGLGLAIARDVARGHGGDVTLSKVAIAHGDLKISIVTDNEVSQPFAIGGYLPGARTAVVSNSRISVEEPAGGTFIAAQHNTVADLVEALNRVKTNTRDIIAILQAVKAAGALHADLIIQ